MRSQSDEHQQKASQYYHEGTADRSLLRSLIVHSLYLIAMALAMPGFITHFLRAEARLRYHGRKAEKFTL
jgi:hypothetical protein